MSKLAGVSVAVLLAAGCAHHGQVQDDPVQQMTDFHLSREALASYVRDPHVTVIVHDVNGSRVYVTGMVGHPGAFPLRNSMNVLQALAGGLAEFADRGSISVLRADGRHVEVDYDDLVTGRARIALGDLPAAAQRHAARDMSPRKSAARGGRGRRPPHKRR
jgi:protein involved in polysaccharide export with SLBB domain